MGRGELGFVMAEQGYRSGLTSKLTFAVTVWALLLATLVSPVAFRRVASKGLPHLPGSAQNGEGDASAGASAASSSEGAIITMGKLKNGPAPVMSGTAGGPKLIAAGLSHDEFRALKAKAPSFAGSSAV